jgi:hypothetical protein
VSVKKRAIYHQWTEYSCSLRARFVGCSWQQFCDEHYITCYITCSVRVVCTRPNEYMQSIMISNRYLLTVNSFFCKNHRSERNGKIFFLTSFSNRDVLNLQLVNHLLNVVCCTEFIFVLSSFIRLLKNYIYSSYIVFEMTDSIVCMDFK